MTPGFLIKHRASQRFVGFFIAAVHPAQPVAILGGSRRTAKNRNESVVNAGSERRRAGQVDESKTG